MHPYTQTIVISSLQHHAGVSRSLPCWHAWICGVRHSPIGPGVLQLLKNLACSMACIRCSAANASRYAMKHTFSCSFLVPHDKFALSACKMYVSKCEQLLILLQLRHLTSQRKSCVRKLQVRLAYIFVFCITTIVNMATNCQPECHRHTLYAPLDRSPALQYKDVKKRVVQVQALNLKKFVMVVPCTWWLCTIKSGCWAAAGWQVCCPNDDEHEQVCGWWLRRKQKLRR